MLFGPQYSLVTGVVLGPQNNRPINSCVSQKSVVGDSDLLGVTAARHSATSEGRRTHFDDVLSRGRSAESVIADHAFADVWGPQYVLGISGVIDHVPEVGKTPGRQEGSVASAAADRAGNG